MVIIFYKSTQLSIIIDDDDFEQLLPITVLGNYVELRLSAKSNEITLEYNDSITLTFNTTSTNNLITGLSDAGDEYVRECAVVNIIDNNRKQFAFSTL